MDTKTQVVFLIVGSLALGTVLSIGFRDMDCANICREGKPEGVAVEWPYHKTAIDMTCFCGRMGLYGEEWVRR